MIEPDPSLKPAMLAELLAAVQLKVVPVIDPESEIYVVTPEH